MATIIADGGVLTVMPSNEYMPRNYTIKKVGKKELEVFFKDANGEAKKVRVYWKHGASLKELSERAIMSTM